MSRWVWMMCLALVCWGSVQARGRVEMDFAATPYVDDNLNLHIELDVLNQFHYPIQEMRVYYRDFGASRFESHLLRPEGFRYLASVDLSDFQGRVVEYFIGVEFADGSRQQFPEDAPESRLFTAALNQEIESGDGIVVISPEPGEEIFTDEFILTVSFFQYASQVDLERTKLFLNTWDVSRYVKGYNDFLTFSPRRVPPGRHTIRLELYDRSGGLLTRKEWKFTAVLRRGPSPKSTTGMNINGNFFAEVRQEDLVDGTLSETYSKAGFRLRGSNRTVSFGTRLFFSNQENRQAQPINRYTAWVQWNFWNNRFLRINGGDTYPQLNPYLLQNVFLRGVYGQVFLKFLNFDFAKGITRRDVEGVGSVDSTGTLQVSSSGTFQRKVSGLRTSFGERKNFQWGLTYVKGRDDVNSIQYGRNPEESAAAGTDIYIATDNNHLILEGSFNLSAYNPNILDGQDEPLDSLQKIGVDIDPDLYDLATSIITVNQYLIVIPAKAYEGRMRLNFLNNSFSVMYKYVQDEFHSLAQPFLLRDSKGLTITDNLRLFRNQLFLNLRYQQYENNLSDIKPATTENRTMALNISYFPVGNLPSLMFGFNNYNRNNGLAESNDPLRFVEDNNTNTINFSTSYAFVASGLNNRISLNLLSYNREDKTDAKIDNLSNTFSFILQTRYKVPLMTRVELNFQQTDNKSGALSTNELSLNSFGAGAEYRLGTVFNQEDKLLFSLNGRFGSVSSTSNTNTGDIINTSKFDYNRSYLNSRLVYSHARLGRISLNADWVNYSGDRSFKDYILTARYDITF